MCIRDRAMFTIIYMVGPKTKVFFRSAIGGALLAAILWEISRRGLGWYMSNVAQYNVLYGTLGTLVALLLWVFYSSNIFIVGAEYAAILNERREKKIAMKGSK